MILSAPDRPGLNKRAVTCNGLKTRGTYQWLDLNGQRYDPGLFFEPTRYGLGDCIKPGTKRTKERSHQNPCAHTVMRRGYTNKKKREELKEAIQPSPYLKRNETQLYRINSRTRLNQTLCTITTFTQLRKRNAVTCRNAVTTKRTTSCAHTRTNAEETSRL